MLEMSLSREGMLVITEDTTTEVPAKGVVNEKQMEFEKQHIGLMKERWVAATLEIGKFLAILQRCGEPDGLSYVKSCEAAATLAPVLAQAQAVSKESRAGLGISFADLSSKLNPAITNGAGDTWIENLRNNLGIISASYNLPQLGVLTKPVLCVGAGPSAWENLDLIEHFKGDVICCERMLPEVLRQGVIPKLVVTMDGWPVMAKYLNEEIVQEHQGKIVLCFAVQAATKTLATWLGPKASFVGLVDNPDVPLSTTRILMQMTSRVPLQMGGNCGCTTWAIARYLNAPRIVLLGMDLADKVGTPIAKMNAYNTVKASPGDFEENWKAYHRGYKNIWGHELITDATFIAFARGWDILGSNAPAHDTIQCSVYSILDGAEWIPRKCSFAEYLATQHEPTPQYVEWLEKLKAEAAKLKAQADAAKSAEKAAA